MFHSWLQLDYKMADYLENHNLKYKRTLKINQTFVFSIGRYEGIWCCWEKHIYIVHGYVVISSLWFPWSSKKYGNTFHRFTCVERQRRKTSLFVNFLLNLFSFLIFSSFIRYSHLESVEPFVTLAITSEGWKGIFISDILKQVLIYTMTILI